MTNSINKSVDTRAELAKSMKAALDNCRKNHKTFHEDCGSCQFDKRFIDAISAAQEIE